MTTRLRDIPEPIDRVQAHLDRINERHQLHDVAFEALQTAMRSGSWDDARWAHTAFKAVIEAYEEGFLDYDDMMETPGVDVYYLREARASHQRQIDHIRGMEQKIAASL